MQLVTYNPFKELQRIERDFNTLWENGWGMLPAFTESSTMDMYEEGGKLVAEVRLPNFKKDEIHVSSDDNVLEVAAHHKEEEEKKNKRRYYLRESSNRYLRRVSLPEGVDTEKTEAEFKNGVLKITLPITTSKKTKSKLVNVK